VIPEVVRRLLWLAFVGLAASAATAEFSTPPATEAQHALVATLAGWALWILYETDPRAA
jgi:hypothetical protein